MNTKSFFEGFDSAVTKLAHETPETIMQGTNPGSSAFAQGEYAACEMSLGWYDVAEALCRKYGHTRNQAMAYVSGQAQRLSLVAIAL